MTDRRNLFEAIVLENEIYFPPFIYFSPSNVGIMRRKFYFNKLFPKQKLTILNLQSWDEMKEKHDWSLYELNEKTSTLTKIR